MTEKYLPIPDVVTFYPWSISATNRWGAEDLLDLRDLPVTELVRNLGGGGSVTDIVTATVEIYKHGNLRKAAEFIRGVVECFPDTRAEVSVGLSDGAAKTLFEFPVYELPESPENYFKNVKVTFVV